MYEQQLIATLNIELSLRLADGVSMNDITERVKEKVSALLQTDFNALVTLLYRIDVDEEKLRLLLETNENREATDIITGLIIERQLQKIKSRRKFKPNNNISEEEKW